MRRHRAGLLALLVMAAVTVAVPGLAQEYPLRQGPLLVTGPDGDTFSPGDRLTVQGSGFQPGGEVDITLESTTVLLTTVSADGAGAIAATVTLPAGVTGAHTLKATGPAAGGGVLVLTLQLQIGPSSGALPFTGGEGLPRLALLGGGALLIGAVAVGIARRRRHQS